MGGRGRDDGRDHRGQYAGRSKFLELHHLRPMQCGEACCCWADRALLRLAFQSRPAAPRARPGRGSDRRAAVSGIGGTLGFAMFHGATASILVTWRDWFASDALGIVTIAPLVIGLASAAREPPARSETIEGLIALASLIIMASSSLHCRRSLGRRSCRSRCCFRSCCGSPARCRPIFAAAAAFIVTLTIVWTTTMESVTSAIPLSQWRTACLPPALAY